MTRGTLWTLSATAAVLLVGCGGGTTPADIAAQACDAQVRTQLNGKPYTLDLAALASTMADDGRGSHLLTAPIIVDAGLASQAEQKLECTARLGADNTTAEVLNLRFIW